MRLKTETCSQLEIEVWPGRLREPIVLEEACIHRSDFMKTLIIPWQFILPAKRPTQRDFEGVPILIQNRIKMDLLRRFG